MCYFIKNNNFKINQIQNYLFMQSKIKIFYLPTCNPSVYRSVNLFAVHVSQIRLRKDSLVRTLFNQNNAFDSIGHAICTHILIDCRAFWQYSFLKVGQTISMNRDCLFFLSCQMVAYKIPVSVHVSAPLPISTV